MRGLNVATPIVLLAVVLQHGGARDREVRSGLLQAGEDRELVLARHGATMSDDVVAACGLLSVRAGIGESAGGPGDEAYRGEGKGANHGVLPCAHMNPRVAAPGGMSSRFQESRFGLPASCVSAATVSKAEGHVNAGRVSLR